MTPSILDPDTLQKFANWFAAHRRPLPWRENPTPYRVWISEIMLQQTVVAAVVEPYRQWQIRWPDMTSLAQASEQEVTRQWEGLGYYSRARKILKTTRELNGNGQNTLPDNYNELIKLPGIGPYTAAAILCLAYDQPCPAVDANIKRIFSRLQAWRVWNPQRDQRCRTQMRNMMLGLSPRVVLEGLMELGQTICTPKGANCEECPLNGRCKVKERNLQDDIPGRSSKRAIRKEALLLLVVHDDQLLVSVPQSGVLQGLYVMPRLPIRGILQISVADFLKNELAAEGERVDSLKSRIHRYTKYAETLRPVVYRIKTPVKQTSAEWKWVSFEELPDLPMASTHRRIVDDLLSLLSVPETAAVS